MLKAKRKALPEFTSPQLTVGTFDLSGRAGPLSVPLSAATYGAEGKYTLITWTTVTYPPGYPGAAAFDVTPPAGTPLIVRSLDVVGGSLVVELQAAMIAA